MAPLDLSHDGGASIVVRNLLIRWRRKHSVSLVTNRMNRFHLDGLEETVVRGETYGAWLVNSVLKGHDLFDDDIFLDEGNTFPVLGLMKFGRRSSTFLHSHGVATFGPEAGITSPYQLRNYAERLFSIRSAGTTIVNSELHRQVIISKFGRGIADRVRPIWHGVDPDMFPESVPTGRKILFVGNVAKGDLFWRKGVRTLISAFSMLRKEIPESRLSIAGEVGNYLAEACEEFGVSQGVEQLGQIPQSRIAATYRASRVLVLPSNFDTYGQVVNEAMASGIPVIVSDMAGASEVVRRANCGLVFRAGDPNGLHNCIMTILGDDELTVVLGKNGAKYARANLTWEKIAGQYIELFKSGSSQA